MSTESRTNTDSTNEAFSAQDGDTRMLLKWGAIITAIVVVTCFTTTSLLKVVGLISASWLWVMAACRYLLSHHTDGPLADCCVLRGCFHQCDPRNRLNQESW